VVILAVLFSSMHTILNVCPMILLLTSHTHTCTCIVHVCGCMQVNVAQLVESGEATALLETNTDEALDHGTFSLPR